MSSQMADEAAMVAVVAVDRLYRRSYRIAICDCREERCGDDIVVMDSAAIALQHKGENQQPGAPKLAKTQMAAACRAQCFHFVTINPLEMP